MYLKKSRVLITGGSGLLGINWAISIQKEYDVILGMHSRIVSLPGLPSVVLNLFESKELSTSLDQINPDIVIHCAGLANVEECESNPAEAYRVNVVITGNLAAVCAEKNIKMVYIATDHLFNGEIPLVTETHPVSPLNEYGKTKWEGESKTLQLSSDFLSIRTNFYGWGTSYRQSFSDYIINALRMGKTLQLFEDFFYTPILIEDLAVTTMSLVFKNASGIFNIVGNERISKLEFGLRLAERFGLNKSLINHTRFSERKDLVKRPTDLSLSNQKAVFLLGEKFGDITENINRLFLQEQSGISAMISAI